MRTSSKHAINTECYAFASGKLLASPEVSEENKQRIKATAEGCNFVKISVKLKVTLDKFYERLARRENIYD